MLASSAPPAFAAPQKGAAAKKPKDKATAKPKDATKKPAKGQPAAPASHDAKEKAAKEASKPAALDLHLEVQRAALDNGLRIVMSPEHSSATIGVAMIYDAGSRDEDHDKSGLAHLCEHLMDQGSKNVARGDHEKIIAARGGDSSSSTTADRTTFTSSLPSNELALSLWLEADRMRSLDASQASFEAARKAVADEHRGDLLGALGVAHDRRRELVYQGFFPYEHPTHGAMTDLDKGDLGWATAFRAKHYGPNSAVLAIAGDFDPAEAISLAHKYFDPIPRSNAAPYAEVAFPEQTSQRTAVVKDAAIGAPAVLYGWAIPPAHSADHAPLEVASFLLGHGEGSRLHQKLVHDKGAFDVSASTDGRRGPDLFSIDLGLERGAKVGDVEKAVEAELKSLATNGPSDAELERARSLAAWAVVSSVSTNFGRARELGEEESSLGDARRINAELPRYLSVGKEDVKRVVAKYLGPTRRTVVEAYPPGEAEPKADAPKKSVAAKGDAPKKGVPEKKPAAKKKGGGDKAPSKDAPKKKKP